MKKFLYENGLSLAFLSSSPSDLQDKFLSECRSTTAIYKI